MQQNVQQLTKERFQSNKIIREKFINFIQDYPNLKSFEFHWNAYHYEIEKSFEQINGQSNHYHLLKEEEQESLLFLNNIKKK